jgi:hypothetical protein
MYVLCDDQKAGKQGEFLSPIAETRYEFVARRARGRIFEPSHGRIGVATGPGSRSFAARFANSHSSGRVSRGSMISSTRNVSAVRNGER